MYAVISPEEIKLPAGSVVRLPGTWQEYQILCDRLRKVLCLLVIRILVFPLQDQSVRLVEYSNQYQKNLLSTLQHLRAQKSQDRHIFP
jgi:hypothetical protein